MSERLGDAPVEPEYRAMMNDIAALSPEALAKWRKFAEGPGGVHLDKRFLLGLIDAGFYEDEIEARTRPLSSERDALRARVAELEAALEQLQPFIHGIGGQNEINIVDGALAKESGK